MEKVQWINNVRVFAIMSVILVHVAANVMYNFSIPPSSWWIVGNVYDSIARSGTPLLLMVTGILFLPREIELKSFFTRRYTRILIPFVFWSFVYILSEAYLSSKQQGTNFFENIWNADFFPRLLHGDIMFHLWYIYMLIGLYLFIPILSKWIKHSTEKEILYFLCIWLITIIISYDFIGNRISDSLIPKYFSGYIGYLVLGYYLANADKYKFSSLVHNKLNGKWINCKLFIFSKLSVVILIFIAFSITIFGTYFHSMRMGHFSEMFYNRLSINVAFATIVIFLFIKYCKLTNKFFLKAINFVCKYSYGVYLVHALVLIHLGSFGINTYFIHPLVGIPITTVLCVGISAGIIFVINKIPFVGKYISG